MRRHIAAQTAQQIALLAAPEIAGDAGAALDRALAGAPEALLVDIALASAEADAGMILERMAERAPPLFVVGSSGVEYALVPAGARRGGWPPTRRCRRRGRSTGCSSSRAAARPRRGHRSPRLAQTASRRSPSTR